MLQWQNGVSCYVYSGTIGVFHWAQSRLSIAALLADGVREVRVALCASPRLTRTMTLFHNPDQSAFQLAV